MSTYEPYPPTGDNSNQGQSSYPPQTGGNSGEYLPDYQQAGQNSGVYNPQTGSNQAPPPPTYHPTQAANPPYPPAYETGQSYSQPNYPPIEHTVAAPPPMYQTGSAGQYGAPPFVQAPPQKSSGKGLWWVVGILGLIAVIVVGFAISSSLAGQAKTIIPGETAVTIGSTAVSEDTTQVNTVPTVASSNGTYVVSSKDGKAVSAKMGETISVDQMVTTLVSAEVYTSTYKYQQPEAGNQFIVVHLKITNNTGTDGYYSVYDFQTIGTDGTVGDSKYLLQDFPGKELKYGTILTGVSVEGNVVFEVAKNDPGRLGWKASYNVKTISQYTWKLAIS